MFQPRQFNKTEDGTARRGRIVVFLGPDGAGKTTVLGLVQND